MFWMAKSNGFEVVMKMPKYYDLEPYKKYTIDKQYSSEYDRGWCSAIKRIMSDKPLDVQPVRRGRWIQQFDGIRCSVCNYKLQTTGLPSYCPHCGKTMEVG